MSPYFYRLFAPKIKKRKKSRTHYNEKIIYHMSCFMQAKCYGSEQNRSPEKEGHRLQIQN